MAEKVMSVKAMSLVLAFVGDEPMNVAQVCREVGISRKSFYKYVDRVRVEGVAGFEPRSRRPHASPRATSVVVEDAIVALRKELSDAGHDCGATTIQWHLGQDRQFKRCVPSIATVHRVLVRRGFVVPQPHKRPKGSWRRFEAPAPNECWQIDSTDWMIATGLAKIFNIIDDHSRVACRSRAVEHATSEEAWTTFCQAAQQWGLPARTLSDNGLCFSGRLRGFEVIFEANLRDSGIVPITGRGYHPQTTGKVERFQQTLKRWLTQQDHHRGLARDLTELQARLDEFCVYYNEHRPHQGIGRTTPLSRWLASPRSQPADQPLEHPIQKPEPHQLVCNNGTVRLNDSTICIGVGAEWTGTTVTVIYNGTHATIMTGNQVIRHLRIDPTRTYQPTGKPRGGPRRPRNVNS